MTSVRGNADLGILTAKNIHNCNKNFYTSQPNIVNKGSTYILIILAMLSISRIVRSSSGVLVSSTQLMKNKYIQWGEKRALEYKLGAIQTQKIYSDVNLQTTYFKVHGRFTYKETFSPKPMYIPNVNQGPLFSPISFSNSSVVADSKLPKICDFWLCRGVTKQL